MVSRLWPLGMAALLSMPFSSHAEDTASRIVPLASAAQSGHVTGVVTLASAIDLALRANPDLAVTRREIDATEGAVRQAGVIPNPVLAASVEDTQDRETRMTTVQINQRLELGGKRSARISAAERAKDLATADLAIKKAEVQAGVAAAFYDVLSAQERLRLAKASSDLAQRATTVAAKRVEAGKVSPVEETRARIAESGVQVELAQAESDLFAARNRLAATWGERQAQFERAAGDISDFPTQPFKWNELASRMEQAPALVRARAEVGRRQALVRLEQAKQIPDVTFSLGAKRDEQIGRNQAIVGVSIPLPLFNRNQGNLQEALSRADKAKDELAATQVRLESELAQSYQQLRTKRLEAQLYKKNILPDAQSAYDAAIKGFEYGKFSFLDVLDAQRTLFQATAQYMKTLSEAHRAAADIERLAGVSTQAISQ